MESHKKKILERYGNLKYNITINPTSHPRMKEMQLEMAKTVLDMELNDLTQQDYLNFKKEQQQQSVKERSKEQESLKQKTLVKGIIFILAGFILMVLGIGFTEATSGSMIFYGLFFSGIALTVTGGFELYHYIKSK